MSARPFCTDFNIKIHKKSGLHSLFLENTFLEKPKGGVKLTPLLAFCRGNPFKPFL